MKTRSSKPSIASQASKTAMVPEVKTSDPPKLFVLPKHVSPGARIVTLLHPRTEVRNRFYFCPNNGFYEFTRVAGTRTIPRSWLLAPHRKSAAQQKSIHCNITDPQGSGVRDSSVATVVEDTMGAATEDSSSFRKGYISKSADLFVTTPLDPLFLLIPAVCPPTQPNKSEAPKQLFLSIDDHLDMLIASSDHWSYILPHATTREVLEARMAVVCDSVEAADEKMYRLSHEKLLDVLVAKAECMVQKGLPASLEEKFVRKALEIPMMGIKREDGLHPIGPKTNGEGASEDIDDTLATPSESIDSSLTADSQTTQSTAATSFSEESPTNRQLVTITPPISAPEGVPHLLRLRTALSYLFSAYLPIHLTSTLNTMLASQTTPIDFSPLDTHILHLNTLRVEALASRSLSDFSRKRSLNEDDECAEDRAEKKRKKEEEERKKKQVESRGVRDLKKVDVSGMKKLSDFFGKGSIKKK
ncbi:MAG: hypothetical protein M1836_007096 [Candelina mexicana]|nr:MAG: hypothetical protein M1836_007096 [Candelina mexicana]